MTNKNTEIETIEQDDDPTAELEALPEEIWAESELDAAIEAESSVQASAVAEPDGGDTNYAVACLQPDSESAASTISTLQFELEQLRVLAAELERTVDDRETAARNLGDELQSAQEKQNDMEELLRMRDSEIESLKSQLSDKAQRTAGPVREIAESRAVVKREATVTEIVAREEVEVETGLVRMIVALNDKNSTMYPIKSGCLTLGSSPDNDIQIKSNFISRHHAQIVTSATECVFKDMKSTNGCYINSRRIKRHAMRNGDLLMLGKHRFKFVERDNLPGEFETDRQGTVGRT